MAGPTVHVGAGLEMGSLVFRPGVDVPGRLKHVLSGATGGDNMWFLLVVVEKG